MEEFNTDMANLLQQMPEEFTKHRQKLLDLAKKCGYDQARILHFDQKSVKQSILTEKTYEGCFKFYIFSGLLPTLKRKRKEFAINLPICVKEREEIIFVLK